MRLDTLNEVAPALSRALEELNARMESERQSVWSLTAKVQYGESRWDVKVDREGHVTVQRQS